MSSHHLRLPPAVIRGSNGEPLLSWRVLILPQLEEEELAKEFRLDEAWDSPHNKPLLAKMPKVFAPPEIDDLVVEPFTTFLQVVSGPGTAFEGERDVRLPDIRDGASDTLLVVEAGEPVPWSKPIDLTYSPDAPVPAVGGIFKSDTKPGFFGERRIKGFHAAFADGSVRFFSPGLDETTLRGRITRNGGEPIPPDSGDVNR